MAKNYNRWLSFCFSILFLLSLGQTVNAQTAIALDSINLSEISNETSQVSFTFDADTNQTLRIEIVAITEGLALQAVIFDGSNNLVLAIGNPSNQNTIRDELTVSSAGTYSIQVSSSNNRVGEFTVRVGTVTNDDICETIILDTLLTVQEDCSATGRNQACLGNLAAEATPIQNLSADYPFNFERVGDIVDLATIDSIALSPFDELSDNWGVAFLLVQADLPDTLPGQNVSMLLFGDVQVNNSAITNPDLLLDYRPMQAFYFTSGIGTPRCNAVPDSGVLIQTPDVDTSITFSINEVIVELGSTAFFSFSQEQTLDIDLLEGTALVSAEGQTQLMTTNQRISIPIGEDFLPSAPPSRAMPIPEDAPRLPIPNNPITDDTVITATPINIDDDERPSLPTDGQCVLRAFDTDNNPNVRSGPDTEFAVTSFILSTELYPVIGRTEDSSWYEIGNGWIAAFVTERGGNCDSVPITYIPPTPTPLPTATPTLPIAGDNDVMVIIDAGEMGLQHSLFGNISSPTGDSMDTISYRVVNTEEHSFYYSLSYSIRCTGVGVEHAIIIFADGSVRDCSPTNSNFIDIGFNQLADSFTIAFDSSVQDAYVTWEVSMSVIEQ